MHTTSLSVVSQYELVSGRRLKKQKSLLLHESYGLFFVCTERTAVEHTVWLLLMAVAIVGFLALCAVVVSVVLVVVVVRKHRNMKTSHGNFSRALLACCFAVLANKKLLDLKVIFLFPQNCFIVRNSNETAVADMNMSTLSVIIVFRVVHMYCIACVVQLAY